ncbi:MAG: hypothetical protein RIR00_952, partial [Pseudomonadota bacterium]
AATARINLLQDAELAPGQHGPARLSLDRPIGALAGDRFILRDASARHTLGGGQVLDIAPPSRRRRSPERLALLAALADPDPATALQLAASQQPCGVDLPGYARNRNLDAATLTALLTRLNLQRVGDSGFAAEGWQALEARMLAALAAEHQRAPDMPGVERERLRRLTLPALPRPAFDKLLAGPLAAGRIIRRHAWLHLPEHQVQFANADRDLWQCLQPLLAASPCNPPRIRDIARSSGIAEAQVRSLCQRLARLGELYPVAHDHYFSAAAVADLAQRLVRLQARDGRVRAATLRDDIGGGRKVAIHILEFFDRVGYTRRVRDWHLLRGSPEQFGS